MNPSQFVDGYEVAVKELVDAKLQTTLPVPQDIAQPAPTPGKVINLMDALRKSIGGGTDAVAVEPESSSQKPRRPRNRQGARWRSLLTRARQGSRWSRDPRPNAGCQNSIKTAKPKAAAKTATKTASKRKQRLGL